MTKTSNIIKNNQVYTSLAMRNNKILLNLQIHYIKNRVNQFKTHKGYNKFKKTN